MSERQQAATGVREHDVPTSMLKSANDGLCCVNARRGPYPLPLTSQSFIQYSLVSSLCGSSLIIEINPFLDTNLECVLSQHNHAKNMTCSSHTKGNMSERT